MPGKLTKKQNAQGGRNSSSAGKPWYSDPRTAMRKLNKLTKLEIERLRQADPDNLPQGIVRAMRQLDLETEEQDPLKHTMIFEKNNNQAFGNPKEVVENTNVEIKLTAKERREEFLREFGRNNREEE